MNFLEVLLGRAPRYSLVLLKQVGIFKAIKHNKQETNFSSFFVEKILLSVASATVCWQNLSTKVLRRKTPN